MNCGTQNTMKEWTCARTGETNEHLAFVKFRLNRDMLGWRLKLYRVPFAGKKLWPSAQL